MSYLLLFILFFLPFIIIPFGISQFELPKIITAFLGIESLAIWFIITKRKKIKRIFDKSHLFLISIIFSVALIDIFKSFSPLVIFGNTFRWQGSFLLFNLLVFSLICSVITFKKIPAFIFGVLLFLTFIFSLFLGNQDGRAIATIGEPNALSAFVVFLWPFFTFSNGLDKKRVIYFIISVIFSFFIVFLSGSRSGLIALVIQILFCLFYFLVKLPLKKAVIIAFILLGLTYIFPFFQNNEYENRGEIWIAAIVAGSENPLLGGGFGNTETLLHNASVTLSNKEVGYVIDSSHNIFLDFLVQGGLISLFSLIALLILTIQNLINRNRILELTILIGIVAALSFNPASIVGLLGFWWCVGSGFNKNST